MTDFTPTEEQLAIVEAAVQTKDNLLVSALAGAAKTSTLVLLASHPRMRVISTLCLAFNKKIALEMADRLPSQCTSMTMNSLGHRVWANALGLRLQLEKRKMFQILKDEVAKQRYASAQDAIRENFSDYLQVLAHAKTCGWIPDSCPRKGHTLVCDADFFAGLDEPPQAFEQDIYIACMNAAIVQAFAGTIDFDDQIYMPTLFTAPFPSYPLTLIDEAQDLSGINHRFLQKLVRSRRLIAVGDSNQAIYGFRGAYTDSMSRLQQTFSMRELTLSTSFRCPRAVCREALWRAPHMRSPEWAKEGLIVHKKHWSVEDLPDDAVIICRNNAPIYSMAIKLLIEDRYPEIIGNDIGKGVLKAMRQLGPDTLSGDDLAAAFEAFKLKKIAKAREHAKGKARDFCLCIEIFLSKADTLKAACDYAEYVMNATGPIKMMTGHKAKGLEFPNVFILDRQLLRIDSEREDNQDANLLYVMQTRAQNVLTYITSEGFQPLTDSTFAED